MSLSGKVEISRQLNCTSDYDLLQRGDESNVLKIKFIKNSAGTSPAGNTD